MISVTLKVNENWRDSHREATPNWLVLINNHIGNECVYCSVFVMSLICYLNLYMVILFNRAVVFIARGVIKHCGRHHKLVVLLPENQFAVYVHVIMV